MHSSDKVTSPSLDGLKIRDAEYVEDSDANRQVFHVRDPHAFVQAAGYLKFLGAKYNENIFFRGQTRLYNTLSPTLYRSSQTHASQSKRENMLTKAMQQIRSKCKTLSKCHAATHEPLLQHYGLKTTWIDLVDNVWIALWFACHRAQTSGSVFEYLHFERRNPESDAAEFAYVLLVAAGNKPSNFPGFYRGNNSELIDLRAACPSIFVRPHAQHGVLFRLRGRDIGHRPIDYSEQVRGVIRIGLSQALSWLGTGQMLGVHALFPPPYYDRGYDFLISCKYGGDPYVGSIAHVGA